MKKWEIVFVYLIPAVVFVVLASLGLYNNYGPSPGILAEKLEIFYEFKIPIYFITLVAIGVWLVASFFIRLALDKYRAEAEEARKALEDELLQATLLNREYYRYRQKDLLRNYFATFLKRHRNIQGIQLFQFEEKHIRNKVKIKVEYEFGEVCDQVNLNAMGQAYYELDANLLAQFRKAKRALDVDHRVPMTLFIIEQGMLLAGRDHQFSEEDAISYAYLDLGVRLLEEEFGESYDFSTIIDPEDHIKLDSIKRTGILRSILLETRLFTFMYKKAGEKKDRLYMGRVLKDDQGLNYLYLVIFDASILEVRSYDEEIARVEKEISEKIVGMLSSRQSPA
ncbi:hypothetical protein [Paenibacillus marinisediminis]